MRATLNSISNATQTYFHRYFSFSLTAQQQKIMLIFSATVACITVSYVISRCLFRATFAQKQLGKQNDKNGTLEGEGKRSFPSGLEEEGFFVGGKLNGPVRELMLKGTWKKGNSNKASSTGRN